MQESRFRRFLDWAHHAYWIHELLVGLGVGKFLEILVARFLSIPQEWRVGIWLTFAGILGFILNLIADPLRRKNQSQSSMQNVSTALVSTPTTAGRFDAKDYFRIAYYSPFQAETENNVRAAAMENQPNDREGFYVKLLGVGLTAVVYDGIWFHIFKSQILALLELNRKNGMLPLDAMRVFYDKAVQDYPDGYADYSFDQWLAYLEGQTLLIKHPSNMIEITLRGKDFLKYLLHFGREASQRRL
jgi:hypothetical protein